MDENFEEFTLGYAMKHCAVVRANGSLALGNVASLLELAESNGVTVYGHTLCWHSNQNAAYMNSIIAPEVVPLEATMGGNLISNDSFGDGSMTRWSGWGNNSTRGVTAEGEGLNGEGYAF